MKSQSIRFCTLVAVAASVLASVSCETTGDPSTGGIFWSERKAQARLDERQERLENIEARTARSRANARAKQAKINRLREAERNAQ